MRLIKNFNHLSNESKKFDPKNEKWPRTQLMGSIESGTL